MLESELIPVSPGTIGNVSQLTVDARTLHSVLQVGRDFSNWIKDRITKYGFTEGKDYKKYSIIPYSPDLANGDSKGLRQAIEYILTLNMGKELAMVENNEIGRMVRRYFIECEQRALKQRSPMLPDFSNPALAARAWAEQYEQRQLAEAQRDEAIRTKARIGSRREATSMAKASAAVRKAARLEDELGRGETYREVKAIPWLYDVFRPSKGMYSVIGKALKRLSADLGYEVKKIPSTEYPDGVNAYHVDVLASFRQELSRKPDMLARYRAPREVEA